MTEEHANLTAEYERLMREASHQDGLTSKDIVLALRHILDRLGPPTAEESADIGIAEYQDPEPPKGVDTLLLDFGAVQAPASVVEASKRAISDQRFADSSLFNAYLRRQNARQQVHFLAGKPMSQFQPDEWL